MKNLWGSKVDPSRKYGMADEIRTKLEEKWGRNSYGWYLSEEPKETIFDFEQYDLWREAFEEKQQEEEEDAEGIGRFGI